MNFQNKPMIKSDVLERTTSQKQVSHKKHAIKFVFNTLNNSEEDN